MLDAGGILCPKLGSAVEYLRVFLENARPIALKQERNIRFV
jgi:hypothetical protein